MEITCEVEVHECFDEKSEKEVACNFMMVKAPDSRELVRILVCGLDILVYKEQLESALQACSCKY